MPCPAWGIDPKHCISGKKLRKQKGTTCSICYACKGHYCFPNVRHVQEYRLQGLLNPRWVEAMVVMIRAEACTHFRWFDSGDLQGMLHLLQIILIAVQLPEVKFWLPTQEHKLVRSLAHPVPDNLTIRLTNPCVNPVRKLKAELQAEVRSDDTLMNNLKDGFVCLADRNKGSRKCGECRACWDRKYPRIIYRRH